MGFVNSLDQNYQWTAVPKLTDQSKTTDTTLAADTALKFSLVPAGLYLIEAYIEFAVDSTNPGFKFRTNISGNNGVAELWLEYVTTMGSSPFTPTIVHKFEQTVSTGTTISATGAFFGFCRIRGKISGHATLVSVFEFQWAQNSSHADAAKALKGSVINYCRIV
jgi:hypothetical protein